MRRLPIVLAPMVFTLLVAACGSSGGEGELAPTTSTTTTTSVSPTTSGSVSTTAATPTTAPDPTVPPESTTTEAVTDTAVAPADTEPPSAPTNVTCGPGGGSQEVLLEWDAPADPSDVVDVRLYVNDGSGFARVNKFTVDSGQILISATRWSAVAYPVPSGTQIQMAVTVGDAAGNESGWNPIDVYYEFAGAECVS